MEYRASFHAWQCFPLLEVCGAKGLPSSLYTDRGSHYFYTPEAGGKVDKDRPTQVGRALAQLGVVHIAAYSPEARGRSERMFGTLQDRLIKELALAGIDDMAAANAWIRDDFLPRHNARFMTPPALPDSAFTRVEPSRLTEALCLEDERTVGRDNTIAWNGMRLQLPESPLRRHYVQARQGSCLSERPAGGAAWTKRDRPVYARRRSRGRARASNQKGSGRHQHGPALGAVKAWPGSGGASRESGATANLDRASSRGQDAAKPQSRQERSKSCALIQPSLVSPASTSDRQ